MILEAVVRRNGNKVFAEVQGNNQPVLMSIRTERRSSGICSKLLDEEKIFINPLSKKECYLVTNFDSGMVDMYFQRMFGMQPKGSMTPYKRRLIAAKDRTTRYRH